MSKLSSLFHVIRPQQWVKNTFVLAGLIFGHAWHDPSVVRQVILATLAFCCLSSSIYIYNDIVDASFDKMHPHKKFRPIASGKISIRMASLIGIGLLSIALLLGGASSLGVLGCLLGYGLLNIFYAHFFKNIVILDVFTISAGFILRLLAGTLGVGIIPSAWLMFCGFMITLFLGFTKRRAENLLPHQTKATRKVLKEYHAAFLDKMITMTASCSIMGYGLYTMNPTTIKIHHTANLIYTVPFVIYGIARYLYLLHDKKGCGQDTANDILFDKQLIIVLSLWAALVFICIS